MFAVGQKIFAKQNWTVVSATRDLSGIHPVYIETIDLQGARGATAILIRTVCMESGEPSQWKLLHNTKAITVDVYTN